MTQGKHARPRGKEQNRPFSTMKAVNGAVATMAAVATLGVPMVAIADEPAAQPQQHTAASAVQQAQAAVDAAKQAAADAQAKLDAAKTALADAQQTLKDRQEDLRLAEIALEAAIKAEQQPTTPTNPSTPSNPPNPSNPTKPSKPGTATSASGTTTGTTSAATATTPQSAQVADTASSKLAATGASTDAVLITAFTLAFVGGVATLSARRREE